MSLNKRISQIIEFSKLTSSEFADEIDVQRSSVSHITSGRNKPSLEFIIKIKSKFPNISWDWLINGEGNMIETKNDDIQSIKTEDKPKPTSLPDLFSLISEDEEFEAEMETPDKNRTRIMPSESNIANESKPKYVISDSQQLEKTVTEKEIQTSENQESKIKRIVFFYENGKFESFEA